MSNPDSNNASVSRVTASDASSGKSGADSKGMPKKPSDGASGASAGKSGKSGVSSKLRDTAEKGHQALSNKKNNAESAASPEQGGAAQAVAEDQAEQQAMESKLGGLGRRSHKPGKGLRNATMAGKAGTTGAKVGILAKAMGFMQMAAGSIATGLSSAAAAGMNVINAIIGWVVNAAQAVGSALTTAFSAITSVISTALSIGTAAASLLAGGSIVVVVATAVMAGGAVVQQAQIAQYDGALIDCSEQVKAVQASVAEDIDENAQKLANAKTIYSGFKVAYGMNDNQIAGVLGCWDCESGFDSTTIECDFLYCPGESYQMGPKKTEAMKDHNAYTLKCFDAYARSGISLNTEQYRGSDGEYWPGIGLPGFTPATNLIDPAEKLGKNWWDLDYQVAFIFATGSSSTTGHKGGKDFWNTYMSECADSSAEDCAQWISRWYEGNTSESYYAKRRERATSWKSQMASWTVNQAEGQSILAMAEELGKTASNNAVRSAQDDCVDTRVYDNSSIAAAAVSYAYPTSSEAEGNNGTKLYQAVHDDIYGSSDIYMSCDRVVSLAIRWSGSDDEYLPGDTGAQLKYLYDSDKWEHVGSTDKMSMEDFQPGDVLCLDGHTFLYTGHELIEQIHGDKAEASSDSVSGSYCERSAGCDNGTSDIVVRLGGQDWIGRGVYQVFRCVKPDHSDKYTGAGSSAR